MNKLRFATIALAATLGSYGVSASAEDCTWGLSSFQISNINQFFENTFSCNAGGTVVATKTVTVRAHGAPSCTLSINVSGYSNYGSCTAPNIANTLSPPSGTKVCEFNDPVTGTTAGCSQRGIGGGGPTIAYEITRNGQALVVVTKTQQNNGCTLAGENSNYRSSGNCNNFRIYAK